MQRPFNRRTFLQSASVGATALASPRAARGRIAGSNDRISIGIIGCGERGLNAHMTAVGEHSETQNLEITAVCDPWNRRRERAAAKVKELYGRAPHLCVSHCDLLALEDVDAVMIASPDHVHTAQIEAAARAGKDIYCEKPLGMEIDKLKSACDAVREAGVVFQAGTQLRSFPSMTGCRELYRTGVLGAVSRIEQCRNSSRPYWYNYLREARPEDVAWEEFLGGRPKRPFSADQFTGWYGYLDFAGGPVPTLGSHFVDLVHYITGAIFPTSAVCQGGRFTWLDRHGFTCPDHVQATWVYPEGFMVSYSTNSGNSGGNSFSIFEDLGDMNLLDWNAPTVSGTHVYPAKKTTLGLETAVPPVPRPEHFLDWFQCLRTRKIPNASIEAGYQHGVAVIMAQLAFETGSRQVYDPRAREIREG